MFESFVGKQKCWVRVHTSFCGTDFLDCMELVGLELLPGRCLDEKDLLMASVESRWVAMVVMPFSFAALAGIALSLTDSSELEMKASPQQQHGSLMTNIFRATQPRFQKNSKSSFSQRQSTLQLRRSLPNLEKHIQVKHWLETRGL